MSNRRHVSGRSCLLVCVGVVGFAVSTAVSVNAQPIKGTYESADVVEDPSFLGGPKTPAKIELEIGEKRSASVTFRGTGAAVRASFKYRYSKSRRRLTIKVNGRRKKSIVVFHNWGIEWHGIRWRRLGADAAPPPAVSEPTPPVPEPTPSGDGRSGGDKGKPVPLPKPAPDPVPDAQPLPPGSDPLVDPAIGPNPSGTVTQLSAASLSGTWVSSTRGGQVVVFFLDSSGRAGIGVLNAQGQVAGELAVVWNLDNDILAVGEPRGNAIKGPARIADGQLQWLGTAWVPLRRIGAP